ncbi:hypothetical protein CEXT_734371 [Caerostris extrusa]|uniref:Uncharacterized protein n=1 Tax=Caerostris extrusa TaxID=172846 RepID=A0AAV4R0N0_CAEEX|nr:hypothetical protein CEXT_734371 [Caerostris extrusa]
MQLKLKSVASNLLEACLGNIHQAVGMSKMVEKIQKVVVLIKDDCGEWAFQKWFKDGEFQPETSCTLTAQVTTGPLIGLCWETAQFETRKPLYATPWDVQHIRDGSYARKILNPFVILRTWGK